MVAAGSPVVAVRAKKASEANQDIESTARQGQTLQYDKLIPSDAQNKLDEVLKTGIQFVTNGSSLTKAGKNTAEQAAAILKQFPEVGIKIIGYTHAEVIGDYRGKEQIKKFALLRTRAVREVLQAAGCRNEIAAQGVGYNPVKGARCDIVPCCPQEVEEIEAEMARFEAEGEIDWVAHAKAELEKLATASKVPEADIQQDEEKIEEVRQENEEHETKEVEEKTESEQGMSRDDNETKEVIEAEEDKRPETPKANEEKKEPTEVETEPLQEPSHESLPSKPDRFFETTVFSCREVALKQKYQSLLQKLITALTKRSKLGLQIVLSGTHSSEEKDMLENMQKVFKSMRIPCVVQQHGAQEFAEGHVSDIQKEETQSKKMEQTKAEATKHEPNVAFHLLLDDDAELCDHFNMQRLAGGKGHTVQILSQQTLELAKWLEGNFQTRMIDKAEDAIDCKSDPDKNKLEEPWAKDCKEESFKDEAEAQEEIDSQKKEVEKLAVRSDYANIRGIYAPLASKRNEGRPVFTRIGAQDDDKLYLLFCQDAWVLTDSPQGDGFFDKAEDPAKEPTDIKSEWNDGSVGAIEKTRRVAEGSKRLLIESKYPNLKGKYAQVPDIEREGRPVFLREENGKDVYMFSEGACWILTESLQSKTIFGKSQDTADHPVGIEGSWEDGAVNSITSLSDRETAGDDANATDLKKPTLDNHARNAPVNYVTDNTEEQETKEFPDNTEAPESDKTEVRLAVSSEYANIAGIYAAVASVMIEGRPVFKRLGEPDEDDLYLLFSQGAWILTDSVEADGAFDRVQDTAMHPTCIEAAWDDGSLSKIRKTRPASQTPMHISIESKHPNVMGRYAQISEIQREGRPVFQREGEGSKMYLFSEGARWILTESLESKKIFGKNLDTADHPCIIADAWEDEVISKITASN
eukprot:gnl/MRDRNA2_/MRDRNA2_75395_c0_seq1.p1 gnl/MRDRNA2_/MRDRNA2_75395_c0~~gnl/MRDRNA2_/MRDRNA2_75395_c0_seq1.p1  ORF type:complete len:933 (-),score=225.90 gnl/MRDRNA2_/MRDRNA2_75395_c0_seq1:285-3041(-)